MHWLQIIFEAETEQAEAIEQQLEAQGALSVTIHDAGDQPLFELEPGATPLWQANRITGLFAADAPASEIVEQIEQACDFSSTPHHRVEILEDKDWVREWMDQYQPLRFGQRLWICPSWKPVPDEAAVNLILDPGLAFGTGTHPTTALCLEWLEAQQLECSEVIDYGCGSGILAIAALLLGCGSMRAYDIDPQALQASRDNCQLNQIEPERIEIGYPPAQIEQPADLLIANILSGPLVELAPRLGRGLKPGGRLVLSGILATQEADIRAAYEDDFEITDSLERDGWLLLEARKKSAD